MLRKHDLGMRFFFSLIFLPFVLTALASATNVTITTTTLPMAQFRCLTRAQCVLDRWYAAARLRSVRAMKFILPLLIESRILSLRVPLKM